MLRRFPVVLCHSWAATKLTLRINYSDYYHQNKQIKINQLNFQKSTMGLAEFTSGKKYKKFMVMLYGLGASVVIVEHYL